MKTISLDQPIARGRTADVYDWEDGQVLKLFQNWFKLENVQYEFKLARAVHASGVKSPAALEQVQVEGRNGLVYQKISGKPMLELFQSKPWRTIQFGKAMAKLHVQMHACVFDAAMPPQKQRLKDKLADASALPSPLKLTLFRQLDSLPEGDRVCHGDFHPANIMMDEENVTVIDWIDATRGNPLADVARTSIITLGAAASSQIPNAVVKVFVRIFHSTYLKHYFRLRQGGEAEYRRWLPIVAGARLSENIPELEGWLVKQAQM